MSKFTSPALFLYVSQKFNYRRAAERQIFGVRNSLLATLRLCILALKFSLL